MDVSDIRHSFLYAQSVGIHAFWTNVLADPCNRFPFNEPERQIFDVILVHLFG